MNRKPIYIFIAVCFGLSLAAAGVFHFAGGVYASLAGTVFASVYMLLPLLSVIITQLLCGEKPLRGCGINWQVNRWWFVAWIGMLLLTAAAVPVSGMLPGVECTLDTESVRQLTGQFAQSGLAIGPWGAIGITLFSGLLAGITINAVFAFGEEIAWRGFLCRELAPLGFWKKSLFIGVLWGAWHAPMILMGHNYPSHPVIGVFMMIVFCLLLSPVLMFLREKSGSVIVTAIAHGTMNAVAGISLLLLEGYHDLLCGPCGLAGMAVLAVADIFIGYILKNERISMIQKTKNGKHE